MGSFKNNPLVFPLISSGGSIRFEEEKGKHRFWAFVLKTSSTLGQDWSEFKQPSLDPARATQILGGRFRGPIGSPHPHPRCLMQLCALFLPAGEGLRHQAPQETSPPLRLSDLQDGQQGFYTEKMFRI